MMLIYKAAERLTTIVDTALERQVDGSSKGYRRSQGINSGSE
jgi:hypothetical protein